MSILDLIGDQNTRTDLLESARTIELFVAQLTTFFFHFSSSAGPLYSISENPQRLQVDRRCRPFANPYPEQLIRCSAHMPSPSGPILAYSSLRTGTCNLAFLFLASPLMRAVTTYYYYQSAVFFVDPSLSRYFFTEESLDIRTTWSVRHRANVVVCGQLRP